MKTLFVTIAVLLLCGAARAEVDLEIVWQKYVYPTRISHAKWSAEGRYIYCTVGNTIQKMDAANGEWLSVFDKTSTPQIVTFSRLMCHYGDALIIN